MGALPSFLDMPTAAQMAAAYMQQVVQQHISGLQLTHQANARRAHVAAPTAAGAAMAGTAAASSAQAGKRDAAEEPGEADDDADDNVVFSTYKPTQLKIGVPHPDPVCEVS